MGQFLLGSGNVDEDDNWGMTQSEDWINASEIDDDEEIDEMDDYDDYDDGFTYF